MDVHRDVILSPEKIKKIIQALTTSKQLYIAYSGGIDSHVLLALTVRAFAHDPDYQVAAIHVHHGIHKAADRWVQHCEQVCANLKVTLTVLWVDGNVVGGRSPEEVAREARFRAFENFLKAEDCLLLAHHEMDQAETILLRLFRGSGPLGLSGIPERGILGNSELIRPLLSIAKEDIVQYARLQALYWIEDESNTSNRFDRNFLRNEIMPLLKTRWPRVVRSVNRAGALCLETATAVQNLALKDLEAMQGTNVTGPLSVSRLLKFNTTRRRSVLRCWLQKQGFLLPSHDHMERIDREVLKAKPGSRPRLKISQYEIRRLKDELSVVPL